jgi:nucleotide-binding universal stress UspA family protein
MTGPIVTGFEGRPQSEDALELGRLLGTAWAAPLLAVWVPDPDEPFSTSTHEALRGRIQRTQTLRAAAARVLEGGPDWELTAQPALWPATGLSAVAREEDARALVVGSSHLGPIGRVVLGSTAAQLLRTAPCPIAVAPRGWAAGRSERTATVGVALDGCEDCELALDLAAPLSTDLGAHLVALSVAQNGDDHPSDQLARAAHGGAERLLLEGDPADTLAAVSQELDLLVVGCRVCAGVLGRPLRSVSRRLLQTAACPLLVVPQALRRVDDAA